MIQSFRDLNVWQKSMDLTVRIYQSTEGFPKSEMFGLTSQLRRASVSIASNIAEGKAIGGQRYRRHLKYGIGSNAELQTQIELASRLGLWPAETGIALLEQASEIGRMIAGLLRSLPKM